MTYCTDKCLDMDIHPNESQKIGVVNDESIPNLYVAFKSKDLNQIQFFEYFQDQQHRLVENVHTKKV